MYGGCRVYYTTIYKKLSLIVIIMPMNLECHKNAMKKLTLSYMVVIDFLFLPIDVLFSRRKKSLKLQKQNFTTGFNEKKQKKAKKKTINAKK